MPGFADFEPAPAPLDRDAVPIVVYLVTRRICRDLQQKERLELDREAAEAEARVVRAADRDA